MRAPAVSINIPTYHQLAHARECVASIQAQTFTDFEVTLYDDGASDEYREYVAALGDPRVRYVRNPVRRGAMQNMFAAIRAGTGRYTLAFHEDDLLAPTYLEEAVRELEREPRLAWVAAGVREFGGTPPPAETASDAGTLRLTTRADALRALLRGVNPMFGSVMYRRAALGEREPDHERYATLVDRPYLLTLLEPWQAAVLSAPLVWYRRHDDVERHGPMRASHILALFRFYRSLLPTQLSAEDRRLFFTYSGYWLFAFYDLIPLEHRPLLARYLLGVSREGLYDPRGRGRFGLRLLLRAVRGARRWA
jgi:glycosyltransferase involved in cell wall biosynthesis